ncbi:ArsR family transcriptional regulator [Candidatus Woesearchaeota archaeon]|nr:MAG: ArsR family transcriptional regulator [Candidatus Woesearchaeota archaeon]
MDSSAPFTDSKWSLLEELSKRPLSPIQLAEATNTSVANISQQLRLLEAYGLVSKERTSNYEKGKPRVVYRIAHPQAFIAALGTPVAFRQLITLGSEELLLLRLWSSFDASHRPVLNRLALHLMPHLSQIHFFGFLRNNNSKASFLLVVNKKSLATLQRLCFKSVLHAGRPGSGHTLKLSFHFVTFERLSSLMKKLRKKSDQTGKELSEHDFPLLISRINPYGNPQYKTLFASSEMLSLLSQCEIDSPEIDSPDNKSSRNEV